jgi:hypothetical protein
LDIGQKQKCSNRFATVSDPGHATVSSSARRRVSPPRFAAAFRRRVSPPRFQLFVS